MTLLPDMVEVVRALGHERFRAVGYGLARGHFIAEEKPKKFLAELRRFLARAAA